ncbi:MAG: DUF294 nucleotidyltransferase-like domain-containing protein [Sulfurovum sp.]|nr:DUF294 nucleotidyltransferase-like domain-containing protein [Sulfurovum sp.]
MQKVNVQIEVLLYVNAKDFEIAKVLKQEIKTYFATLEETFSTSGGKDFLVKHTQKIDTILQLVYKVALRSMFGDYTPMKNSVPIALVALGSYGREQLCVHSDIDLMLVYKEVAGYNSKEMIEKILYILWDTGLKLGHRVHTVEELFAVSKTDITIKTALLESRFIDGSHFIWVDTQNAITQMRHHNIREFIQLKLQEQDKNHRRFSLTMEPNLKEGVGGFRDANLVYWLGKIFYNAGSIKELPTDIISEKAYRFFRNTLEFLFRVRSALHLVCHKKEDKLRLDLIPSVSQLLGFEQTAKGHTKFSQKVTESLKIIRLYSSIWIDKLTHSYVEVDPSKNYIYPKSHTLHGLLKQLNSHAQKPFYAHPSFLQRLIEIKISTRPDEALYAIIREIFYQPHSHGVLRTLSYARLLKYVIVPIKGVVDLPQFDGYHQYAVDIHSIRCMYYLENIDDSFIQNLFMQLSPDEKALLKMVTFFT